MTLSRLGPRQETSHIVANLLQIYVIFCSGDNNHIYGLISDTEGQVNSKGSSQIKVS